MPAANTLDLFGGGSASGTLDNGAVSGAVTDPQQDALSKLLQNQTVNRLATNQAANINAKSAATPGSDTGGASYNPAAQQAAFDSGNIGGATGEYNAVSPSGKAALDYYHDLNSGSGIGSAINRIGEGVGISHAGDVAGNPLTTLGNFAAPWQAPAAALAPVVDPNKGLGTTVGNAGGAVGGKPVSMVSPGTQAAAGAIQDAATAPLSQTGIGGGLGGLINQINGSGPQGDASGADRGSSKIPGIDDAQQLNNANAGAAAVSNRGDQVLSGQVAPGGQGADQQQNALDQSLSFLQGPRATSTALSNVNGYQPTAQSQALTGIQSFLGSAAAPSAAQAQLATGNQAAMSDALSLARSGRARDAGSQARALNVAQAENAATNVDAARNAATLSAQEAQQQKTNQLSALGLQGQVAGGVDSSTLGALNLGGSLSQGLDANSLAAIGQQGDIASQMRTANTTERGQSLGYDQGTQATAAGLTSDVLKTIPQIETVNHADQFGLTPDQQVAVATAGKNKDTLDTILGLGKDVLPLL